MWDIRLSYKSRSWRVAARVDSSSISVMLFWRRQRRATALNLERRREGMEDTRAWTQSISSVSEG